VKKCCSDYLDEQFGGDADLVGEIYGEYVMSVNEKTAELNEAIKSEDWLRIDRIAHALKGNALAAGDTEMADTAIAIRKSVALKEIDAINASMVHIEELKGEL
jgi:HPt (histidine-containing phosphotransfer) domain-containing protein